MGKAFGVFMTPHVEFNLHVAIIMSPPYLAWMRHTASWESGRIKLRSEGMKL